MANPFKGRGFSAYREEAARREKIRESKMGKLFRFFIGDKDEEDIEIRFLTDEPILFYEHSVQDGGRWVNVLCTGDSKCPYCDDGNRPQYKGAFLIVDTREFETDERDKNGEKTGNKVTVKDRVKLLVRGTKDIAKLDRLNNKYGLLDVPYYVTKVGSGNQTSYEFDHGSKDPLSNKQIQKYLSQLPEKYRNMEPIDIVEANLFGDEEEEKKSSKKDRQKARRKEVEDEIEEDVIEVEDHKSKTGIKKVESKQKKNIRFRKK